MAHTTSTWKLAASRPALVSWTSHIRPSGNEAKRFTNGPGSDVTAPPPHGTVPEGQVTWPEKLDPAGSVCVAVRLMT